ncbi:MAG: hypothetical protein U0570_00035 [Phycisphaerales bacterium]
MRARPAQFVVVFLAVIAFHQAGCESSFSRETRRISEKYNAQMAALTAQYDQQVISCETTPNPANCKDQKSRAYRDALDALWRAENAEMDQALDAAIHGRPPNPSQ